MNLGWLHFVTAVLQRPAMCTLWTVATLSRACLCAVAYFGVPAVAAQCAFPLHLLVATEGVICWAFTWVRPLPQKTLAPLTVGVAPLLKRLTA